MNVEVHSLSYLSSSVAADAGAGFSSVDCRPGERSRATHSVAMVCCLSHNFLRRRVEQFTPHRKLSLSEHTRV